MDLILIIVAVAVLIGFTAINTYVWCSILAGFTVELRKRKLAQEMFLNRLMHLNKEKDDEAYKGYE